MDDISHKIGEYISMVRFEDLSPAALASARKSTLDTMGAMLAGSGAPGIDTIVSLAKNWGGAQEAHLVGFGDKLPAPLAVWCNASMGRALEIDDCLDFLPVHPSVSIVPALLALAELKGSLSGRDFLTALAVGQDLIIRMGLAVRQTYIQSGRHNMFRIFGPAAALSRAMDMGPDKAQNTLGIAFSFAIGDGQCFLDGALTVMLQEGVVAHGAFLSALLSANNFTGAPNFLLGDFGYLKAFEPNPHLEYLNQGLGKEFLGERITIKPFSSCRGTHAAIDLALNFRSEMNFNVRSIRRITFRTSPEIFRLLAAPQEVKIMPESALAAQYSIQFTVAAALIRGDFFLKELEPESFKDKEILDLAQRVYVEPDPSLRTDLAVGRTVMEIELEGNSIRKHELEMALGSPSRPMKYDQCVEKFMKCADYSACSIDKAHLEQLIYLVSQLEDVPDVSSLVSCLF
jgi:2-methylcitrate dehydratase PrpD